MIQDVTTHLENAIGIAKKSKLAMVYVPIANAALLLAALTPSTGGDGDVELWLDVAERDAAEDDLHQRTLRAHRTRKYAELIRRLTHERDEAVRERDAFYKTFNGHVYVKNEDYAAIHEAKHVAESQLATARTALENIKGRALQAEVYASEKLNARLNPGDCFAQIAEDALSALIAPSTPGAQS
jgi:hypothetical protein